MQIKSHNYLFMILTIIALFCLFYIKDRSDKLNYQLNQIKQQMIHEQEAVQMLKAELSYLKSPERIKALSQQYLQLRPITLNQIISNFDDDKNITVDNLSLKTVEINKNKLNRKTNWRYKRMASKYIQVAVGKK